MFWVIQSMGVVATLITCISFFQKEKWKMMLWLSITNIILISTYILCGSLLGGLLCAGALVRTLVFLYFNKFNKKPEVIILILFEIYYVVISIIMWQSPIDLLMLVNLVIITYTSWQDNIKVLRFGYVASSLLLIPYDILLGAYTTILSEIVMLIFVIVSLIKYSKVTKSYQNVAQRYFYANKNFWGSNVILGEDYDMIISNTVDASPYCNFGILKNYSKIYETLLDIKDECKKYGVKEIAYLPFDSKKYNQYESTAQMLSMFFHTEFHDVWMKLIDGFNLNNTKCKIQGVECKEANQNDIDDIIEVYLKGYHSKTDINDLSPNEKLQVQNLKNIKLNQECDGYTTSAYIAYYKAIPVSLVIMLTNKIETFITKVSTIPIFRRKHIASTLMQFGVKKQRERGVQEIMLVTDKNSINETFYTFNNFVEFGQAFALDISDTKKYDDFIKNKR
ncbi:MAG: YgjV family protein [Candidatus Caccovivens sp.]